MTAKVPETNPTIHFDGAVDYGVLLDVSHLAKDTNFAYPCFITAAFWNRPEIHRDSKLVQKAFRQEKMRLLERIQKRDFGSHQIIIVLGNYIVPIQYHIIRSSRFGLVVVAAEPEEGTTLRAPRPRVVGSFQSR